MARIGRTLKWAFRGVEGNNPARRKRRRGRRRRVLKMFSCRPTVFLNRAHVSTSVCISICSPSPSFFFFFCVLHTYVACSTWLCYL